MKKNKLVLHSCEVSANAISYRYNVEGEWARHFQPDEPYVIEYPVSLEGLPLSVAVVPFLCNMLPVAWVLDGEIFVDVCDEDFFACVHAVRGGYQDMYPGMQFKGALRAGALKAAGAPAPGKSAVFYSGGVDAVNTLFRHFEEKPPLMTIWGADIQLTDEEGWARVSGRIQQSAKAFGLSFLQIKSPFRTVINEISLSELVRPSGDLWWHGYQHGIGILGHAAPLAYVLGLSHVYIASSFCKNDGKVYCASYPTIDNQLRFCGCRVVHDGFEQSRQDKVGNICRTSREMAMPVTLHVCWQSQGGGNCCRCEKCIRTMLAILAENEDPARYGFRWNAKTRLRSRLALKYFYPLTHPRYDCVLNRLRETQTSPRQKREWAWLMNSSVEKLNNTLPKRFRRSRLWGPFLRKIWVGLTGGFSR